MGLETFTFITSLVNTNPVGATDPKSQGDDHLRGIKTALLNSFPNINAAVNATPAQLNVLTGNTNDRVVRVTGAALNMGQLTAGMFPNTVVPDAALSANVPLLNVGNAFSLSTNGSFINSFVNSNGGASAYAGVQMTGSDTLYLRQLGAGFSGAMLTNGTSGPASVLATTGTALDIGTSNTARLTINGSGNFDFKGGTVTTNNASASEVGKIGEPIRNVTASDNTAASDQGGMIRFTGGSGQTFTLDSDPPAGATLTLLNTSGNNWTIAASSSVTLNGTAGSFTHASGRIYFMRHVGGGVWYGTGF